MHCVPLVRGSIRAAARVRRVRLCKTNYVKKNNSYAHDDQGDNPGQATEGSTVSSIKCDRCWHLISSIKVLVVLTSAEVIDLAGSVD